MVDDSDLTQGKESALRETVSIVSTKQHLKKMNTCAQTYIMKLCYYACFAVPSTISIPGEMRVQLLNQTLLDLGFYDDGPYEVADQKQLNAQLIPVPSHSYLGRSCPPCSLLPGHRRESEGWRRGDTRALTVRPT